MSSRDPRRGGQRRGGERRGRQPSQRDKELQERAGERQAIAESREALAQQVLINIDPQQDVEVVQTEDGPQVQLTDDAAQRQAEQLRQQAAEESDRFDESDFIVDRSGGEINVEPTQSAIDRERRKQAAEEFESQSEFINNLSPGDVKLTDDGPELREEIIEQAEQRAQQQAQQKAQQQASQQRQQARQDFAESIESGDAFDDLPDGVDASSLIDNVDPQDDIVREGDSLELADDVDAQIKRNVVLSQIPDSATSVQNPDELVSGVVDEAAERAAQSKAAREALEEKYPDGVEVIGTAGFGTGEVGATRLDFSDASRETLERYKLAGRDNLSNLSIDEIDSRVPNEGGGVTLYATVDVSNNDQLNQAFRSEAAEVVDEQLPGDQQLSADDIGADGSVEGELPSLRVDSEEITASGITEGGRDDVAQQQLTRIGAQSDAISPATPTESQAFANVVAELGSELDDPSLTARQDVLADLPFGSGDINVNSATALVSQIDPQQAAQNDDIDLTADQIRQAQQDIESQQQQLQNDPSAVLDEIVDQPDDFIERATLLNTQNKQGRAKRSAAREQINEAEEALGEGADLQLSSDAEGIGDINDAARESIQEQAAEPLPNFAADDINVSVDDGQINTAVDESTLERTQQLQVDIAEQQARNEIADSNPNIDRGDIEVEAGEGVSPSDELVAETLGSGFGADVESFEELEQAVETQRQQQALQQVEEIDQRIATQPIGPQDVQFRETDGGVVAELTPEAERRVDESRVDLEAAVDDATAVESEQFGEVSDPNLTDDPLATTPDTADQISRRLGAVSESFSAATGSAVAQASLLPAIEQATVGTDRSEQAISGVVEGFARVVNPAEQVAAGAQLADLALTGPDGNISREFVGEATADRQLEAPLAGQSLDGPVDVGEQSFVEEVGGDVRRSFEEDPAEAAGQTLGFVVPIAGSAAASSRVGAGLRSLRQVSTRGGRRGLGDLVEANPQSADEIADVIDNSVGGRRRRGFSNADRFESVETIDPEFGGVRRFDTTDVTRELRFGGRRRRDISQRASRIDEGGVSQRESADLSDLDFSEVDTQVGGGADEIEVPATSSSADEIASGGARNRGSSKRLGSGGRDNILDAESVDTARDVSDDLRTARRAEDTTADASQTPTEPVDRASLDEIAEGVGRGRIGQARGEIAELARRLDEFTFGESRGQASLIPQGRRTVDDAGEVADERLSANLRQQTITQRQRELDEATEGGTFEGEPATFSDDARRAQAEADAEAIARQERLADDATSAEVSEAGDDLSAAVSSAEAAERSVAAEQAEEPAVSAEAQEPVAAAAEQQAASEIEARSEEVQTVTEADVGEVTGSPTLTGEQTPVTGQTLFEVGEVAVTGTETAQEVSTIGDTAAVQSDEFVSQNVEVGSFGDVSQELDQQQDGAVGIDIGSGAGIDIGGDSVGDVGSDTAVDTVLDVAQTEAAASATDQSAVQDTQLTERLLDPLNPRAPRAPRTPGRPPTPPSIRISPEEDDDGGGGADDDGFDLLSLSAGVGDRGPAVGFVAEQLTAFATGGFGTRELPEQTTVPVGAELTTATLADPDPSEEDAVESIAETFGIGTDDDTEEAFI